FVPRGLALGQRLDQAHELLAAVAVAPSQLDQLARPGVYGSLRLCARDRDPAPPAAELEQAFVAQVSAGIDTDRALKSSWHRRNRCRSSALCVVPVVAGADVDFQRWVEL